MSAKVPGKESQGIINKCVQLEQEEELERDKAYVWDFQRES